MSVLTAEATSTLHTGHAYYFCSQACREKFEAEPAKYVPQGIPVTRSASMANTASSTSPHRRAAVSRASHSTRTIPVVAFGLGLSLFLAISFTLFGLGFLLFPGLPIAHGVLSLVLPGFVLLNWPSFFLGLIESLVYGWYVALIFGPLYNFFAARTS
ncbi:MAG: YHS domain-containing protein [Pseudomonadota bacterium]